MFISSVKARCSWYKIGVVFRSEHQMNNSNFKDVYPVVKCLDKIPLTAKQTNAVISKDVCLRDATWQTEQPHLLITLFIGDWLLQNNSQQAVTKY